MSSIPAPSFLSPAPSSNNVRSLPPPLSSTPSVSRSTMSGTNARTFSSSSFNTRLPPLSSPPPLGPPLQPMASQLSLQPSFSNFTSPSTPVTPSVMPMQPSKPNYNITLPQVSSLAPSSPAFSPAPASMSSIMAPLAPTQTWNAPARQKPSESDWGDFDPLA